MSKTEGKAWKTKYGIRRVRDEGPTIEEAIAAARGLSDDQDEQVEIASSLIGLPQAQVRAAFLKLAPARPEIIKSVMTAGTSPGTARPRVVVVESKRPRRVSVQR